MKISVIGLGKLGLCTAACFASKGVKVIGHDKNESFISSLDQKKSPIDETGLAQLLEKAWDNLAFTLSMQEAVENSDATLIIVPTPSGPDGRFINDYVCAVLEEMAPFVKEKRTFHIIDVVSTVMPGTGDTVFRPLLEKLTGKVCGRDFGLVYNPEFIALGSVVHNFLNPDMVLIGASDNRSAQSIKALYASMADSAPHFAIMSLVNAEIAKLSLNCFVTMKISFANELGALCEKIPGADVDAVTSALGADTRIGAKYLKSGLGFGGPCFPRDNIAFQMCAKDHGYEANIGPQVVKINKTVPQRLMSMIAGKVEPGAKIAVLGLSYKPHTHIIEESQSVLLVHKLIEEGFSVCVHDPKAMPVIRSDMGDKIAYAGDAYQAAHDAAAIYLMTDWPEYRALDLRKLVFAAKKNAVLIDCWRIFGPEKAAGFVYHALGKSALDAGQAP